MSKTREKAASSQAKVPFGSSISSTDIETTNVSMSSQLFSEKFVAREDSTESEIHSTHVIVAIFFVLIFGSVCFGGMKFYRKRVTLQEPNASNRFLANRSQAFLRETFFQRPQNVNPEGPNRNYVMN